MIVLTLLVLSLALSGALLVWSRRQWLPIADGTPWWRAGVLTGVEDLRVGATAVALTAAVSAMGATVVADSWHDRLGPLERVQAVVVTRTAEATVVVPLHHGARVGPQLPVENQMRAPVGSIVHVYVGRHAAVSDDDPPAWNVWSISSALLLVIAAASAAASLHPRARLRLVPYRA